MSHHNTSQHCMLPGHLLGLELPKLQHLYTATQNNVTHINTFVNCPFPLNFSNAV